MARRRKGVIDESLYATSLFELVTGEKENEIVLDTEVNDTSNDFSWMISACFYKDGKQYMIKKVDGATVFAAETSVYSLIDSNPLQTFDFDEVKALLERSKSEAQPEVSSESTVSNDTVTAVKDSSPVSLKPDLDSAPKKPASLPSLDFHYETSEEDYFTKGNRVGANLQAIHLLKELEAAGRKATVEEQTVLARYSGWGGLSDAFKEEDSNYVSVVKALSGSEYKQAKASMLTAYYTPLFIIESIYKMLSDAGFKGGRVLEPSCGIGKFFGMMPKRMFNRSMLYGVELDDISARIAQQLYPTARIQECGFEEATLFSSFYDLVISNVPFGEYKVNDPAYNKLDLMIHDYFICKAVDMARTGGFVIVLTEHNTLDRQNKKAREYISKRAELIGALRLPENTFGNSHTKVVTDIIILRKKANNDEVGERFTESVSFTLSDVNYNRNEYFTAHPEMILGEETVVSGQFRNKVSVKGDLDADLLNEKLSSLSMKYEEATVDEGEDSTTIVLPDELVFSPNYSFVLYQGEIWYRNNGLLELHTAPNKRAGERLRAMLPVRDKLLELYEAMKSEFSTDDEIKKLQKELEQLYDYFVHKNGFFSSNANSRAFSEDSKYPLLCALEVFDRDTGEYIGKADIFTERTIKNITERKADNAYDALQISLVEKDKIDFEYMSELTGIDKEALKNELLENYQLFKLPFAPGYADAATYLSGYVKDKLKEAKAAALNDDSFKRNVEALEKAQPADIPAHEIFVPLGATWVPTDIYESFMYETFKTSKWNKSRIKICRLGDTYKISNKSNDNYRTEVTSVYGTASVSAYELLEDALNLRSTKVYTEVLGEDGKTRRVVDRDKTIAAQQKQEEIKVAFDSWIFEDRERRERIERLYNDTVNNIVLKEYDGSYLTFPGMNKNIELMPHQKNAVMRIIQNGNTLLAHRVGAGKTFTMIAAAMELKRLGLCNKSLFVVPNHLLSQWAGEIVRLYPLANVLIATAKDFSKQNRKKFCSKIATGNYDAILCTHSQFSMGMPLSKETQLEVLSEQMNEIEAMLNSCIQTLDNMSYNDPNMQQYQYSERQLEIKRKTLQEKIEKLMDTPHDETVTFEDLGVDQLFIDEAHLFKNLAVPTKLRNVSGLTNAESKKAQDLLGKVMYLNEKTNYRGVVFATGTPISNAICELYVMQKYLEPQHLERAGVISFDAWVSFFAETETKIEVKPEGTGYRSVIRCCKYHNLPELMNLFRLVADIKVTDLQLNLPDVHKHHVAVKPSDTQKEALKLFAERAEKIRSGGVERYEDNMLCVTNDGRKLAIDQRMYNIDLENDMKSKLNRCARTVAHIWRISKESRATQLVFLDLGTPKSKDSKEVVEKQIFDAYNAFKETLLSNGVAEDEIAFIHDANTDTKKIALFEKVNAGAIRILLGSTDKLGAGTNVQKRLLALHHVDCRVTRS